MNSFLMESIFIKYKILSVCEFMCEMCLLFTDTNYEAALLVHDQVKFVFSVNSTGCGEKQEDEKVERKQFNNDRVLLLSRISPYLFWYTADAGLVPYNDTTAENLWPNPRPGTNIGVTVACWYNVTHPCTTRYIHTYVLGT